jgi:F-type H+-transporting ATPase subunit gamma
MPQSTKEITRRIKSVGNTKKITKAMELVAASKMKKSIEATLASRFYAHYSWEILTKLAAIADSSSSPLLSIRPVRKIAIVLVSSEKGLCGSYNSAIFKKLLQQIGSPKSLMVNRILNRKIESAVNENELEIEYICIGKKGAKALNKINKKVNQVFSINNDIPKLNDVRPLAQLLIADYEKTKFDKVVVVYTDYVSAIKQEPKIRQLLPLSKLDLEKLIEELDTEDNKYNDNGFTNDEYLFEPNKKELLNSILPKLVEMQLYQMIMESTASENSARMMAMKNATEAAGEMINELTLIFNKARQSSITQEIAEISSGKAALEI